MKGLILLTLFVLSVGIPSASTGYATEGCSEPEYYDETHDIERCNEGHYLIDREDGSKAWVSSQGGVNKVCEYLPNGEVQCIQTP